MSNYREMYICKFLHYKETINGGENINEIETKVIIRKFYSCFLKKEGKYFKINILNCTLKDG